MGVESVPFDPVRRPCSEHCNQELFHDHETTKTSFELLLSIQSHLSSHHPPPTPGHHEPASYLCVSFPACYIYRGNRREISWDTRVSISLGIKPSRSTPATPFIDSSFLTAESQSMAWCARSPSQLLKGVSGVGWFLHRIKAHLISYSITPQRTGPGEGMPSYPACHMSEIFFFFFFLPYLFHLFFVNF